MAITRRYVYANCMKTKGKKLQCKATWDLFLKCFDCMAQGLDLDGSPLYVDGAGWLKKFVKLFGGADMEGLCLGWGLKSYNDVNEMCGLCLADRDDRPFTDMADDAGWRPTCPLSHEVRVRMC